MTCRSRILSSVIGSVKGRPLLAASLDDCDVTSLSANRPFTADWMGISQRMSCQNKIAYFLNCLFTIRRHGNEDIAGVR